MGQSATYAFSTTSGSFTSSLLPLPVVLAGQLGIGKFVITMHAERTITEVGIDGTVVPLYVPGNHANVLIEMQQNSPLHAELLALYNILTVSADGGNPSTWAGGAMTLRNNLTQHVLQGIAFNKKPDKPYAERGSRVTWNLTACDAQEIAV